jgi:hypothetical protein
MPGLTTSNLSLNSPLSINASPPKYGSFSKISERFEADHLQSDGQILSARSGIHGKENSCEISAIVEENSGSEHHQGTNPSIIYNVDKVSNLDSDSSEISLSIEKTPSMSLPVHNGIMPDEDFEIDKQPRSSLSMRFKSSQQNLLALSFEEAYSLFKSLSLEFFPQNLWIRSLGDFFCCKQPKILENEDLEICEKLIVFTYLGFNQRDFFHSRLLASVFERFSLLGKLKETWIDIGFSSNNPHHDDLKHDVAPLGLFQLLFIEKFMPEFVEEFLNYCLEQNMAFIMIAFDMSEISVVVLRKKLLNSIINQSSKSVETIFFLYAGCLFYWFSLHKNMALCLGKSIIWSKNLL